MNGLEEKRQSRYVRTIRGIIILREPAHEIVGGSGEDVLDGKAKVITNTGKDVTREFNKRCRRNIENYERAES